MIGFIGGTGPEGRGLALRFAMAGESVMIGSRDSARARDAAASVAALGEGMSTQGQGRVGEMTQILSAAFDYTYKEARKLMGPSGRNRGAIILLVKEWTKARVSVSSLVLRYSFISSAKAATMSALSRNFRLSASSVLASRMIQNPSDWSLGELDACGFADVQRSVASQSHRERRRQD